MISGVICGLSMGKYVRCIYDYVSPKCKTLSFITLPHKLTKGLKTWGYNDSPKNRRVLDTQGIYQSVRLSSYALCVIQQSIYPSVYPTVYLPICHLSLSLPLSLSLSLYVPLSIHLSNNRSIHLFI